ARARGRAGTEAVQRRRVQGAPGRLPRRAHRRRALPGEITAPRRMEGETVQHVLRRHVQRAAAEVGAAVRLGPAGGLPQVGHGLDGAHGYREHRMELVKAHAYGNDFLLVHDAHVSAGADRATLARALCERHRGIGADGLIVYSLVWSGSGKGVGAAMDLLNADGSYSEVSGNGVRCLAAWLARERSLGAGGHVDIETDAGVKRLELLSIEGARYTFRAAMGQPEEVRQRTIDVDG